MTCRPATVSQMKRDPGAVGPTIGEVISTRDWLVYCLPKLKKELSWFQVRAYATLDEAVAIEAAAFAVVIWVVQDDLVQGFDEGLALKAVTDKEEF